MLTLVLLFTALEIYEVQWQKAGTLIGMLARMFEVYKKSIFIFLVMHPTFYFAIYFMLVTEYNVYALSLFGFKMLDIAMKLMMMKQVFIDKEITHELSLALMTPLGGYIPYIGLFIYIPFIFLALT